MKITIQVRHDATPERIKRYIRSEFVKLRMKDEILSADCVLDQEGTNGQFKSFEAVVRVTGDTIAVRETARDVVPAINAALVTLDRLLVQHKETHTRPGGQIRHTIARKS